MYLLIGAFSRGAECAKTPKQLSVIAVFLLLFGMLGLFRIDLVQAQSYGLDRKASSAEFSIHSGIAVLEGRLGEFDAELRLLSATPLRFQVEATANLRSLKLNGSDQLTALTNGTVVQSLGEPEMRISGELKKSLRGAGCLFEGTVQRGKQKKRMSLPCSWKRVTKDEVFVTTKIDGSVSSLLDDLPFQLPFGDGEATARGSFAFLAKTSR